MDDTSGDIGSVGLFYILSRVTFHERPCIGFFYL